MGQGHCTSDYCLALSRQRLWGSLFPTGICLPPLFPGLSSQCLFLSPLSFSHSPLTPRSPGRSRPQQCPQWHTWAAVGMGGTLVCGKAGWPSVPHRISPLLSQTTAGPCTPSVGPGRGEAVSGTFIVLRDHLPHPSSAIPPTQPLAVVWIVTYYLSLCSYTVWVSEMRISSVGNKEF